MPTCVGCSQEVPATASFCPRCGTPNPEAPTVPTPTGGARADQVPPDEIKLRLQRAMGRDYAVGQVIGEGGFAVVFSVHDRKLSRQVAVKVLRAELTASRSTVQRFVREAESAARLTHPHILPIFFVGEGEGLVYFGMPLVEGETLESRLAREKTLPEPEVTRIGADIADALLEAHEAGLVHRDVKPANVLLQGAKRRVLVADFGIAKAAAGVGEKLTGTGSVIGSPHYMSPEQASGSGHVDHRSDIYSLGVVLWQMLAGELPFDAPDTQGILVQHLTQPLPSLARKRPGLSPALVKTIERCCAKRPDDRFQSVADVAEALRTGIVPAARVKARRRPLVLAIVASIVVVGGAVVAILQRRSPAISEPGETAAAVDSGRSSAPMVAVLPFDTGDSALARQSARNLAATLGSRFGVGSVDFNRLYPLWIAERRSVTGSLDSNGAFAYRLGANQLVIGSVSQAGTRMRIGVDVYDTRNNANLGHYELDGAIEAQFTLLDQLAESVAVAFCKQPEFNPRNLCYDTPAAPRAPVAMTYSGPQLGEPPTFNVLVSARGEYLDVQPRRAPADLIGQALPLLRAGTYTAAKRRGVSVAAWTTVALELRSPLLSPVAAPHSSRPQVAPSPPARLQPRRQ